MVVLVVIDGGQLLHITFYRLFYKEALMVLSLIEPHPWYFPGVSPPRLYARDVLKRVPILLHVIIFTGLNFRSGIYVFHCSSEV